MNHDTPGQNCAYAYNADGIRTAKAVGSTVTSYYLDGGNVVGEKVGTSTTTYLRGINLISKTKSSTTQYYLHNAHGDVVNLTNTSGNSTKAYSYDVFGNEKNQVASDANPFRYCGEYLDKETNEYYLRARYYDPAVGRFSQADTHWNPSNMIYGDNPQQIGEYKDALGLSRYTYLPIADAISQAGNLYTYCMNSPVYFVDYDGLVALCVEAISHRFVNGQGRAEFSSIQFGTSTVGASGCGAIAVYNSLVLLGDYDTSFRSVLDSFTMKNPLRWCGVLPWEIERYYSENGINFTHVVSIDEMINQLIDGKIAIMTFWIDTVQLPQYSSIDFAGNPLLFGLFSGANMIDFTQGAHTVVIKYNSNKQLFIVYNAFNDDLVAKEYTNLYDYLENGVFISGTCI